MFQVTYTTLNGGYREPSGDVWLSRLAQLDLRVSCPGSPDAELARLLRNHALEVTLCMGPSGLYGRLPFNCHIGIGSEAKAARIVEFSPRCREKTFTIPIQDDGSARLTVTSELAGVPSELGLGPDERELALLARFSVVQRAPDTFATNGVEAPGPWAPTVIPLVSDFPRPVFVVGMYRSGTSILTWAIGQHPNIWALEETGFLPILANGVLASWARASAAKRSFGDVYEIRPGQYPAYFGQSIDGLMRSIAKEHAIRALLCRANGHEPDCLDHIQMLRALGSSKRRWVDGTPENVMAIAQLVALFPGAKFIHIVRNPVAVAASMARFDRIGGERAEPSAALETWGQRVRMAHLAERAYGGEVVRRIRYEELIDEPKRMMREIFEFLEEPDFDAAAEIFSVRLNSSQVTPKEVEETRKSIAQDVIEDALDLYGQASANLPGVLSPDPAARCELDAFVNDQVTRLEQLYA